MHQSRFLVPASAVALLVLASSAWASALAPTQACLDAKHKAVGKHVACVVKVYGTAAAKGLTPDYGDCDDALAAAFTAAETTYGAACRTTGDAMQLASRGAQLVTSLDTMLDPSSATGDALSCVLAKVKAAGKRAACGEKAEDKLLKKDLVVRDTSRCDDKLSSAFTKAASGGACPAGGLAADVIAAVDSSFAESEADLANLGTADFASKGRYRTGFRTFTFVDSTRPTKANGTYTGAPDRTIPVVVYYPAVAGVQNAAFADLPSPAPLVVRAHGLGGFSGDSNDLMKQLASRGMIVVSPSFPLSSLGAPGGVTIADLDQQIVDVSFVIDRLLAMNATVGGPFEGRIDASRIGLVGHSLGGATVLGTGYHPTLRDPRVDVVIGLAPFACMYQEAFFDGGGTEPLMILSGTADLVTLPTSNHVAPYNRANPEKYLVTLDGGLHIGFANDFLNDDSQNADDVLACPALLPPGSPRPVTLSFSIPPDFLGGIAAGVDTTGASCEPLCPLPTATWMAHARQRDIELASVTAMLEHVFDGNVSADRLITGRIDTENADVTLAYER
jgi:acetyl esterase/lipase